MFIATIFSQKVYISKLHVTNNAKLVSFALNMEIIKDSNLMMVRHY